MTKDKKIGLILLVAPICLLVIVLIGYAFFSFVMSTVVNSDIESLNAAAGTGLVGQSKTVATAQIINVVFGLLGVLAVIGIIVGVPLGIVFLAKKEPGEVVVNLTGLKYQGLSQEQLVYISRWSWGAFFGSMVWSLGNKLYLWALPFIAYLAIALVIFGLSYTQADPKFFTILSFLNIPLGLVSFIVMIYLSIKGRRLAWVKGWPSFKAFKNRQKVIAWIILAVFILGGIIDFIFIYYNFQNMANSSL